MGESIVFNKKRGILSRVQAPMVRKELDYLFAELIAPKSQKSFVKQGFLGIDCIFDL